jgi:hypothetical protein
MSSIDQQKAVMMLAAGGNSTDENAKIRRLAAISIYYCGADIILGYCRCQN